MCCTRAMHDDANLVGMCRWELHENGTSTQLAPSRECGTSTADEPALSLEPPSSFADSRSPSDLFAFRRETRALEQTNLERVHLERVQLSYLRVGSAASIFCLRCGHYFPNTYKYAKYRQSCALSQHTGKSVVYYLLSCSRGRTVCTCSLKESTGYAGRW